MRAEDICVDAVFVTTLKHWWSCRNADGTTEGQWHTFNVLCVVDTVEPHMAWYTVIKVLEETGRPTFEHYTRVVPGESGGGFALTCLTYENHNYNYRTPRKSDLVDAPELIAAARAVARAKSESVHTRTKKRSARK